MEKNNGFEAFKEMIPIIAIGLPVLSCTSYICVYIVQVGYLGYFGISAELAEITLLNATKMGLALFFLAMSLFPLWDFYFSLSSRMISGLPPRLGIRIQRLGIGFFCIPFSWLVLQNYIAMCAFMLAWLFTFWVFLWDLRRAENGVTQSIEEKGEISNSRYVYAIVGLILLLMIVSVVAGATIARNTNTFANVEGTRLILITRYDTCFVAKEFNPQTHILQKGVYLIPIDDLKDKKITWKMIKIKEILRN